MLCPMGADVLRGQMSGGTNLGADVQGASVLIPQNTGFDQHSSQFWSEFTTKFGLSTTLKISTFENITGKGENAGNLFKYSIHALI